MESYDAIVVGAGIAGMMAATDLNHRGYKVLVIEHNHQPGGLMSGIWRRGFYFDVGCQSFENMGIIFPLLEQYGLSDVAEFHRVRYRLKMPGIDTVVYSLKQARQEFKKSFPQFSAGFDRVFDMHDKTSALVKRMFVPEAIPFVRNEKASAFAKWLSLGLPWIGSLKTLMWDDFEAWYKKILPQSGVRDLLATCGYTRMNVFVASAFWHLWAEDYWYPKGGYQLWFDRWAEALEKRGVRFLYKDAVVGFEKDGDRASAVLTKKGQHFEAKEVVYAGDYKRAVYDLIGAERFSKSTLQRLEAAKHSDPLISVYLGLNMPAAKLKEYVHSSHIFYFPHEHCRTEIALDDTDAHKNAFLEVTAHCIDDPTLAPEGKSSVVLQAFTRGEWLNYWKSSPDGTTRNAEYKDLKKIVGDELITIFEGIIPDVRKFIEYVDVGSPMSTIRFTKNELGGSCGFELNWRNFPFLNPLAQTKTPLKNVHMAGHFTVWPGAVPTAALSGKIASLRAHQQLIKRVRRTVVPVAIRPASNVEAGL